MQGLTGQVYVISTRSEVLWSLFTSTVKISISWQQNGACERRHICAFTKDISKLLHLRSMIIEGTLAIKLLRVVVGVVQL